MIGSWNVTPSSPWMPWNTYTVLPSVAAKFSSTAITR
jgi:hypothetical protein